MRQDAQAISLDSNTDYGLNPFWQHSDSSTRPTISSKSTIGFPAASRPGRRTRECASVAVCRAGWLPRTTAAGGWHERSVMEPISCCGHGSGSLY